MSVGQRREAAKTLSPIGSGDVGLGSFSLDTPIGALCKLLPSALFLEVDETVPVSSVCQLLHERGQNSCLIRPSALSSTHRFFSFDDLCSALLDALRADRLAARVLSVLGASAVRDVARRGTESLQQVSHSTPLSALLGHLTGERHKRLLVKGGRGQVLRLFEPSDLIELLLRHGQTSCSALKAPARALLMLPGGAAGMARTASATDIVLRCFEDLKTRELRGLPVLDGADPMQSVADRALGTLTLSDVRYFFLMAPEEAAQLITGTARDFINHEIQEEGATARVSSSRGQASATRCQFVHADAEMSTARVASKLLVSRSPCIAICSASGLEIRNMATADDIVDALANRLCGVCLVPTMFGPLVSPRMWPSVSEEPRHLFSLPEAAEAERGARVAQHGSEGSASPAPGVEYATEQVPPSPSFKPLALEDAQEAGIGDIIAEAGEMLPPAEASPSREGRRGSDIMLASSLAQDPAIEAIMSGSAGPWQQLVENSTPAHGHMDAGHRYDHLQLVMYQQRDLVLYDRRHNRAYARRLSEEQANALSQSRHSYCPLCRQVLDPVWAYVVEGYFDMLSSITPGEGPTVSGNAGFSSNEEAAAAAGLHNIPSALLNCGYYSRFFVEEKKLGAGSFGAVYLCRHVMDEIELGVFAVKKLALGDDVKRLRQVIREVKALERLRHMNIIDYKHSWLEVSRHSEFCPYVPFLFILMEYCNAGSLEDLIWPKGFVRGAPDNAAKATLLAEELIWLLFLDVCRGLRQLHSRSILHRDLKPSNILLNVDEIAGADRSGDTSAPVPRALLSDFGTCEILGEGISVAGHVHGGYAIEFMAPERLRGEESDEPADMWSAGITLYAMCYGDLPYHSEDPATCRAKVVAHTVLSELPEFRDQALRGLISGLTAREPVARPTAEEAERVSQQAAARLRQDKDAAARSKAPAQLPCLAPLELMDAVASTSLAAQTASSPEPQAKILRISSHSSLSETGTGVASRQDAEQPNDERGVD